MKDCFVFSLVLFCNVWPGSAMATASVFETDGFIYKTTSDSTVELTDCKTASLVGSIKDGCLEIPAFVSHEDVVYKVTQISYELERVSALKQVILPETIVGLWNGIFRYYNDSLFTAYDNGLYLGTAANPFFYLMKPKSDSIETCVIAPGCNCIALSAFRNCSRLREIAVPQTVKQIEDCAFLGCSELLHAEMGDSILYIGKGAFAYCSSLRTVSFDGTLQEIGRRCFYACRHLESITIPQSVKCIGTGAFEECVSLQEVHLPDGLTNLKERAFLGCSKLDARQDPRIITLAPEPELYDTIRYGNEDCLKILHSVQLENYSVVESGINRHRFILPDSSYEAGAHKVKFWNKPSCIFYIEGIDGLPSGFLSEEKSNNHSDKICTFNGKKPKEFRVCLVRGDYINKLSAAVLPDGKTKRINFKDENAYYCVYVPIR